MKIFIVDDDELVHKLYEMYFKKVVSITHKESFFNGFDAIKFIEDHIDTNLSDVDIILLDINMPIMDGVEFLDHFERIAPRLNKIPSIFIVSSCLIEKDFLMSRKYVTGLHDKPLSELILKNMIFNQVSI
ncbi:response regulator [Ekhidna sp.]|uniref:response regulator n=1 Tax=Ekhidna sp. TaxID=2608089 RepID=UPI00329A75C9